MNATRFAAQVLVLGLVPGLALGGFTHAVPEPGALELLGLGSVIALVVSIRHRRNKK